MTPNVDELVEQLEFPHKLLVGMQNGAITLKKSSGNFFKTGLNLPYGLVILLLEENENICSQKDLYEHAHCSFIIIAKIQKQPKYPSKGECVNTLQYVYVI